MRNDDRFEVEWHWEGDLRVAVLPDGTTVRSAKALGLREKIEALIAERGVNASISVLPPGGRETGAQNHMAPGVQANEPLTPYPKGVGHEQHGDRYAVVVQADEFLPHRRSSSPRHREALDRHRSDPKPRFEGKATCVLVEQIGAVDARRLGEKVGHLTHEELWGVDEELVAVLGLR